MNVMELAFTVLATATLICLRHQPSLGIRHITECTKKLRLQDLSFQGLQLALHIAHLGPIVQAQFISQIFTVWLFSLLKETAFFPPAILPRPRELSLLGSAQVPLVACRTRRTFLYRHCKVPMMSLHGQVLIHEVVILQKEMLLFVDHGVALAKHVGL